MDANQVDNGSGLNRPPHSSCPAVSWLTARREKDKGRSGDDGDGDLLIKKEHLYSTLLCYLN